MSSSLDKPSSCTAATARLASWGLKPSEISALTASASALETAATSFGSATRGAIDGMLSQALKRSLSSTSRRSAVFLPTPGIFTSVEVSCACTQRTSSSTSSPDISARASLGPTPLSRISSRNSSRSRFSAKP
ncbi:hypothetical protein D9M71_766810 [compost metagenome]